MQVDFYQLSRDPVEQVLPAIAGRILDMGARLLVVAREPERLERISAGLWAGPPESFLAHGRAGDDAESVQPVLLAQHCPAADRSEEHTSELQSLMRISYAVFCLKKKNNKIST